MNQSPFTRRIFLKASIATSLALVSGKQAALAANPAGVSGDTVLIMPEPLVQSSGDFDQLYPYTDQLLILAVGIDAECVLGEMVSALDNGDELTEELRCHWNFQIGVLDEDSVRGSLSATQIRLPSRNRRSTTSHVLVFVSDRIDGHLMGAEDSSMLRRDYASIAGAFGDAVTGANINLHAALIRDPGSNAFPIANEFICQLAEHAYLCGPPIEIATTSVGECSAQEKAKCLGKALWKQIKPLADRVAKLSTSSKTGSGQGAFSYEDR